MDKLLLISNDIETNPKGGRELLCKLNHDILKEIYKDDFSLFELGKNTNNSISYLFNSFKGHIDGINTKAIQDIFKIIQANNINKIFIDGSNLGQLAKVINKRFENITIYTFFHNVESRFFLGSLRERKTLKSFVVLLINYLAERKAVKYSKSIICINERDSVLLNKIYNKKATDIYPMSLEDKFDLTNLENQQKKIDEKYILFVGGTFYANVVGILWFIKNVLPKLDIKLYIVGKGFEKYKSELENNNKIKVIGPVDNLQEWYINSHFVIAPIFDGSGMKTKVAEALMYGKKIIGTKESFTGYEEFLNLVGEECNDSTEFIYSINKLLIEDIPKFDPLLRNIYMKNYSYQAAKKRLFEILRRD